MSKETATRNINLDLIRCTAIFSVISVHFFANVGFYQQRFVGTAMYGLTIFRTGFMVCVPLFCILTGYLCSRKELSHQHFTRIYPIVWTYVCSCIIRLIYRIVALGEDISLMRAVFLILDTSGGAIGSSWYVNMYLGLYLMIPFLNIMYTGLETQRRKLYLLTVLFFTTAGPSLFNSYDWFNPDFLLHPVNSYTYQKLVPDWWISVWPITYYYIGAYIREYDIRIPIRQNLFLFVSSVILFGSYNFYRSYGGAALFTPGWDHWGSYENVIESVLLFLFLLHLDLSRVPAWIQSILIRCSKLSFGMYLCSSVSDAIIYPLLVSYVPRLRNQYLCAPLVVMIIFILSAIMSQLIQWIQVMLSWIIIQIKSYRL